MAQECILDKLVVGRRYRITYELPYGIGVYVGVFPGYLDYTSHIWLYSDAFGNTPLLISLILSAEETT